MEAAAM